MKAKKLLFYLLAALLAGCVPVMSLNPLYTEKDVIFEEKLLGKWVDSNDPNNTWDFQQPNKSDKGTEKTYNLILSEKDKKVGSFDIHLLKLENKIFLDACPNKFPCKEQDSEEMEWPYNASFMIPVHTFLKVDSIEPLLRIRLTDDDEMEKLLKENPNAVEHTSIDDTPVLTASTKELQAFVLKYADDGRLFTNEIILTRKKTKDPNEPNGNDPNKSKKEE